MVKSLILEVMIVITLGVGLIYFFKRFVYVAPTGVVLLPEARRTLSGLAGCFFLLFASEFYIQRYELLTKGNELISGIGFSDDYGSIPILYALVFVSLVGAVFSFSGIVRPGMKKILLSVVALSLEYFVGHI